MSLEVQKMSDTHKPKQPKFTLEFKQDAARLVVEKGYTHKQAADSLGVSESALGRWVRAERNSGAVADVQGGQGQGGLGLSKRASTSGQAWNWEGVGRLLGLSVTSP